MLKAFAIIGVVLIMAVGFAWDDLWASRQIPELPEALAPSRCIRLTALQRPASSNISSGIRIGCSSMRVAPYLGALLPNDAS